MLAFLAPRATPGVETVENGVYRRSISLNGSDGHFEVALDEKDSALIARVQFGDPRSLFFITERIRAMFDLNADWVTIVRALRTDPVLVGPVEARRGLRVPGCWNGFELATRAILGQQITVKGATVLTGRLVSTFGRKFSAASGLSHVFPEPAALANANLTSIGLPGARAETIQALARAVCSGQLSFDRIVDSDAFLTQLCEIPGIGKWTAQYVAMRALREPDAFPCGDLGLLHALNLESARALEQRSEAWRPWRAYAAMYLWSIASKSKARGAGPLSPTVPKLSLKRTASQQVVSAAM